MPFLRNVSLSSFVLHSQGLLQLYLLIYTTLWYLAALLSDVLLFITSQGRAYVILIFPRLMMLDVSGTGLCVLGAYEYPRFGSVSKQDSAEDGSVSCSLPRTHPKNTVSPHENGLHTPSRIYGGKCIKLLIYLHGLPDVILTAYVKTGCRLDDKTRARLNHCGMVQWT